jgi:hypothetical protein
MLRKALALNPNFAFPQADDARQRLAGDSAECYEFAKRNTLRQ